MKNKKFFLMVLMVCLTSLVVHAIDFTLIGIHDSRYIINGIDFAVKNDAAIDVFGISIQQKKFNCFLYSAVSESYFESGVNLNYTLRIGSLDFKSIVFPLIFVMGKTYWGIIVSEEAILSTPVAQIMATWTYAYIPHKDFEGLSGHYFFLGVSKEIYGLRFQVGSNYNLHSLTPGRGFGGIISMTKSIELNSKTFLDVYFKYYINTEKINKDEQIVGAMISVKL